MTAPKIFSKGDLSDFLIDWWKPFATELRTKGADKIGVIKAKYILNQVAAFNAAVNGAKPPAAACPEFALDAGLAP